MNSVDDFIDIVSPAFDFCFDILSFELFGIPFSQYLLNLLFISFVLIFIRGGMPSLSSGKSSRSETKSHDRAEAEKIPRGWGLNGVRNGKRK